MNKTEVKKLLVAERKSMREKQSNSVFLRRTCSMFSAQKKRAEKLGRLHEIDYTLEDLRNELTTEYMMPWWECGYCKCKLSMKRFVLDHMEPIARGGRFSLSNLACSCPACNFQKGILTNSEFGELLDAIKGFDPVAGADIKRRLTIGGKWGVRV